MKLIVGEFYRGQGLGNQLYTYASIRGLARLNNMCYAFASVDQFKGHDLFELDFGVTDFDYPTRKLFERRCIDQRCGHDVAATDAELIRQCNETKESVKVEGLLAGKGYWPGGIDFLKEILILRSEVCAATVTCDRDTLIHVRGGDFLSSNSQLGGDYYQAALRRLERGLDQVAVLSDDPRHVYRLFGQNVSILSNGAEERHDMTASHHRGGSFVMDFIELLHARQIILSNSSFAFWGAVLNLHHARVIAPRYWAAHSCVRHHWSPGDLQYQEFEYV